MNKRNTEVLYTAFPELYIRHLLPVEESSMAWGFQCDDGWFEILYELSDKLTKVVSPIPIEATQVKQKWGALRYCVNIYNKEAEELILLAENKAKITCESCGKKDAIRYVCGSWRVVLCENCVSNGKVCLPEDELYKLNK